MENNLKRIKNTLLQYRKSSPITTSHLDDDENDTDRRTSSVLEDITKGPSGNNYIMV